MRDRVGFYPCTSCGLPVPPEHEAGRFGKREPICEQCHHEIDTNEINEFFTDNDTGSEGENQDTGLVAGAGYSW